MTAAATVVGTGARFKLARRRRNPKKLIARRQRR